MADQPNLDYEPCPPNTSYSRLGPPPETAAPAANPAPEPRQAPTHYETAAELVPGAVAGMAFTRPNRRRHRFARRTAGT